MKLLTRNPLPCRIQNLIKNGTLRGLFSFYRPILFQGFDRKSRKNMRKTLFKGSSHEMPKVKNYFLVNIYFIYRYSKIKKNWVTRPFFKLEAFNVSINSKPDHPPPRAIPGNSHILVAPGVGFSLLCFARGGAVLNQSNFEKNEMFALSLKQLSSSSFHMLIYARSEQRD